jgi:hypothetical protein
MIGTGDKRLNKGRYAPLLVILFLAIEFKVLNAARENKVSGNEIPI